LENREGKNKKISRGMWEVVKTSTEKTGMEKTKRERSKEKARKRKRRSYIK